MELTWTDTPEWPFHSYVVDRVIKEDHYAGVHPVHELPLPADGGPYELLDTDLEPGQTWEYTLKAVRGDGITHPYGPIEVTIPDPRGVAVQLHQPYPNPAVNTITLEYELPSGIDAVMLSIYDLSGRRIDTQTLQPTSGRHSLVLDVGEYPQGVYIARLAEEGVSETRGLGLPDRLGMIEYKSILEVAFSDSIAFKVIITDELARKVVARRNRRNRKTTHVGSSNLLGDLVCCEKCGLRMQGWGRNRLACSQAMRGNTDCNLTSVSQESIIYSTLNMIFNKLETYDDYNGLINRMLALVRHDSRPGEIQKKLNALEKSIKKWQGMIDGM